MDELWEIFNRDSHSSKDSSLSGEKEADCSGERKIQVVHETGRSQEAEENIAKRTKKRKGDERVVENGDCENEVRAKKMKIATGRSRETEESSTKRTKKKKRDEGVVENGDCEDRIRARKMKIDGQVIEKTDSETKRSKRGQEVTENVSKVKIKKIRTDSQEEQVLENGIEKKKKKKKKGLDLEVESKKKVVSNGHEKDVKSNCDGQCAQVQKEQDSKGAKKTGSNGREVSDEDPCKLNGDVIGAVKKSKRKRHSEHCILEVVEKKIKVVEGTELSNHSKPKKKL